MEITLVRPTSVDEKAVIKVIIQPKDYNPEIDKEAKKYAKTATFKGFRPGQAPLDLVRHMIAKDILQNIVFDLLSKSLYGYLDDNKLAIIGYPIPTEDTPAFDTKTQKEFHFYYYIGLVDDFEVNHTNINFTNYQVLVNEEMIDKEIESIRNAEGETKPTDNPAEATGVSLRISLTQINTDKGENDADNKVTYEEDSKLQLDDLTPIIVNKLKTLNIGEEVEGTLEEIFEDVHIAGEILNLEHKHLHNNPNPCTLMLKGWLVDQPTELNEAFFEKHFPENTPTNYEEYREKLSSEIQKLLDKNVDSAKKMLIKEAILENTTVELPKAFFEYWMNELNEKEPGQYTEKNYKVIKNQLKWDLISSKLTTLFDISVSSEEVLLFEVNKILSQFGGHLINNDEIMKRVFEMVTENFKKKPEEFRKVSDDVKETKLFDKLLELYQDMPKTIVTMEELNEVLKPFIEKQKQEDNEFQISELTEVETENTTSEEVK